MEGRDRLGVVEVEDGEKGETWAVSVEWDNGISHIHYAGPDGSYNLETAGGVRRSPQHNINPTPSASLHVGSRVVLSHAARAWSKENAPTSNGHPLLGRVVEVFQDTCQVQWQRGGQEVGTWRCPNS